jgi:hypothetical protein
VSALEVMVGTTPADESDVAALFGALIGATLALAGWWEDEPSNAVTAVGLGVVATLAASRFAYRRGIEGYLALVFVVAFGFAIFLALH